MQAALIESRSPDLVRYLTEQDKSFWFADGIDQAGTLIEGNEEDLLEATMLAQALGAGIVVFTEGEDGSGSRICTDSKSPTFGGVVEDDIPFPALSRLLTESVTGGDSRSLRESLEESTPLCLDLRPIDPGFLRALGFINEADTPEEAEQAEWESRDKASYEDIDLGRGDDDVIKGLLEACDLGEMARQEDFDLLQNASALINKAIRTTFGDENQFPQLHEDLLTKVSGGNLRCIIKSEYELATLRIFTEAYAQVISSALTDELFLNFVFKSLKTVGNDPASSDSSTFILSNVLCDAAENAVLKLNYSPKMSEEMKELLREDY